MSIREKELLDLELMSYTDIAYEIIKEDKKQYNTPNLFKIVCDILKLTESDFESKIGDFFTALTTDKRFILIDSVNWDLKENHIVKVIVDDDSDSEEIIEEESDETEEENDEDIEEEIDEDDYSEDAIDDIEDEDDMDDLTIIEDEDLEE